MNSKAPQRVSSLARFCNKYTREHFNIALGVLEYLLQTSDVGIRLDKVDELKLVCYTDASWGSWDISSLGCVYSWEATW